MSELVIDLAPDREQTEFNFERWAEIQDDPQWDDWIGRIDTDRHGNILSSPRWLCSHMLQQDDFSLAGGVAIMYERISEPAGNA